MKQKLTKNNNSFEIPKYILFTGKLLQTVNKNLATKFAANIFGTPLRFKTPERELMMRDSAKKELINISGIDKDIMVYRYGFSNKKILLVHGWSGRGTQLYQLADKILENKMMVISFDGPAHGLSSGKKTIITDFTETIKVIDKKYGPFHAAIGHSFGGMVLLNSVAQGLKLKKLVTIGTDNSIKEIMNSYVKKLKLKPVISDKLINLLKQEYFIDDEMYSSYNTAKKIEIPTFVIHDTQDKFVPVRSALKIRQNLKYGHLLITNGLGHHKIFKKINIINRIVNFIK